MYEVISVLLVDDHSVVRQGVRAFLVTQPDLTVVGEAASGEEAVRLAEQTVPDVILMDLIMPNMDGVEATRRVHPRRNLESPAPPRPQLRRAKGPQRLKANHSSSSAIHIPVRSPLLPPQRAILSRRPMPELPEAK